VKLTYDVDADALYIRLREGVVAATEPVLGEASVDVDGEYRVIGIEVIDPDRLWPLDVILRGFPIEAADARQLLAFCPFRVRQPIM
jgi:uncharacterized protein YuzE